MLKYAKIIDEEAKTVSVGTGTDTAAYKSMGFKEMDVERAYDGIWYLSGYAPEKPTPTKEEQSANRERAYQQTVDPITCHISRLTDEEQTEEVKAEVQALKSERAAKVAEIKAQFPYPEAAA